MGVRYIVEQVVESAVIRGNELGESRG